MAIFNTEKEKELWNQIKKFASENNLGRISHISSKFKAHSSEAIIKNAFSKLLEPLQKKASAVPFYADSNPHQEKIDNITQTFETLLDCFKQENELKLPRNTTLLAHYSNKNTYSVVEKSMKYGDDVYQKCREIINLSNKYSFPMQVHLSPLNDLINKGSNNKPMTLKKMQESLVDDAGVSKADAQKIHDLLSEMNAIIKELPTERSL